MKKAASAKLALKDFSNTALLSYAIKVNTALDTAPGSTNFPTPPVPVGAATVPPAAPTFGNLIDDYQAALGAAYKGSKTETAAKDEAKAAVINALQQNWNYVNKIVKLTTGNFPDYPTMKALTLTSGYKVIEFSRSAGPLDAPQIRSITSPATGQLKVILNKFSKSGLQRTKKIRGTKVYEINYRTSEIPGTVPTPAGPWNTEVSSAYFFLKEGLASGSYDVYVKAKGANPISAQTSIRQIVVL